jgi:hypothetical protein
LQDRLVSVFVSLGLESFIEDDGMAKLAVQAPTRTSDHLASEDAGIPNPGIPNAGILNAGILNAGMTGKNGGMPALASLGQKTGLTHKASPV